MTQRSCCPPPQSRPAGPAPPAPSSPHTDPSQLGPRETGRPAVTLPGGTFLMGTDYAHAYPADGEGPVRPVTLAPFAIDTFPVSNADFATFTSATGYRTESERFGWSFVFWMQLPPGRLAELVEDTVAAAPWWCKVAGADWRHPEGPGSDVFAAAHDRANHPVVQVSWNDAQAYAAWAGRQLPTEAQWEYAARGGLVQKLYPWGDDLTPNGHHRANLWQGDFPRTNTADDGWAFTCPVDAFPPNAYGLYSLTGNTWEWTADLFRTTYETPAPSPLPDAALHPRTMKGGSFLCHASYCNRYRVAARTANSPDSAASNVGFRCVLPQPDPAA